METYYLKPLVDSSSMKLLVVIIQDRVALIAKYSRLIEGMDPDDASQWQHIVAAAREGGVNKEALCEAFSCAWSTVLRWQAGRNAPGQFSRGAMKARLLGLLGDRHAAELERLKEAKAAVERVAQAA